MPSNNKNPWSKVEPSDGLAVDLYTTNGKDYQPGQGMMGPPTEQQMADELWKQQVLRQYLFGGSGGMSMGRMKATP